MSTRGLWNEYVQVLSLHLETCITNSCMIVSLIYNVGMEVRLDLKYFVISRSFEQKQSWCLEEPITKYYHAWPSRL